MRGRNICEVEVENRLNKSLGALKAAVLCVVMAGLAGCVWAPGMDMETSPFQEKTVDRNDFRQGVTVQPINGALVARQLAVLEKQSVTHVPDVLLADPSVYQYKIAAQDVLQITVWDHPELTNPAGQISNAANAGELVYDDGTIFYPYVGVLHVAGKTMEEVRADLTRALSGYISKPQVGLRVSSFRGQFAYVTGQVKTSGALPVTDLPLTVMNAISQAGGVLVDADLQHATLTRQGKSYPLDLLSLYERGEAKLDVLLQHGDVLNIPDNQLNKLFVLGEVTKPSTLFIKNGKMTLAEAISDSQGFGAAAHAGQVYVIRGQSESTQVKKAAIDRFDQNRKMEVYHLDASSADALILADQFHLQARDVVYVSKTPLKRFTSVFSDIGGLINTSAQTLILKRAAGF